MNIGFTGTRHGMTPLQAQSVAYILGNGEITSFHHGDCIGADAEAHALARGLKARIVIHPPEKGAYRAFLEGDEVRPPRPYLQRNHDIVDATDMLIVAPETEHETVRSGTWAAYRYARKKGKDVAVVLPNGTIRPS